MRRWQTIHIREMGRHVHAESYAALVLSGRYEEAGDHGRFQVQVGDAVLHDRFEAHLNRFAAAGVEILNLDLPEDCACVSGVAGVPDPDGVARVAERSAREAVELLLETARSRPPALVDWCDALAAELIANPSLRLFCWAAQKGLAPWTVSRSFARVYGISPEAFRVRARARRAWHAICGDATPLAGIAAELGFADQAHMTRSVRELTGRPPRAWRLAANGFKTAARR
jgi:AraC-like DNA-binding protein